MATCRAIKQQNLTVRDPVGVIGRMTATYQAILKVREPAETEAPGSVQVTVL